MPEKETLALGRVASSRSRGTTLTEVFELSYRKLVVQLYAVVGDAAEAEDLVQEAFFVAPPLAGRRFAAVANPEAWLRTHGPEPAPEPVAQTARAHPLPAASPQSPASGPVRAWRTTWW